MKPNQAKCKKVVLWLAGLLLWVVGNFFWPSSLQAAGVVGTGTPGTCTEAALIGALAGGGTVTFNCGGPATIQVNSRMSITADSIIDGGGVITLDGGLTTGLFYVIAPASLTLNNITLNRAYAADGDGGAIRASGPLFLSNTTIQNSVVLVYCGGAIWTNGLADITNSTFYNNTGESGGGAVCTGSFGTTQLQITNSHFNTNKAVNPTTGYGGAIFVSGPVAAVTIVDSSFIGNSAHLGGALGVFTGGSATVSTRNAANQVLFLTNSASETGGAIFNMGTLKIYGSALNGNAVPQTTIGIGYGGGIANLGSLTLYDSSLSTNQGRFGAGLFVGSPIGFNVTAQAEIQRTNIDHNVGVDGGGIYTNTGATVTIANSSIQFNQAGTGAGISRFNARLDISNSSITDNQATGATGIGGGLYSGAGPNSDPTSVSATSTTFGGNTAGSNQGGGIYTVGYSVFKNLTIKDNTNGLFNAGTYVTTHLGNSVLDNGPGYLNCDNGGVQPVDDGKNLSTDNSCPVLLKNVPAQLGPRATNSNGINQTRYYPPLAGSPLINEAANCPPLDQRGAIRTNTNTCDIGAIEYGGLAWFNYLPLIMR